MNRHIRLIAIIAVAICAWMPLSGADFTAATYNLRNANQSDAKAGNGWSQRMPWVAGMVRFHGFDIFGTQECFRHQLDSLSAHLPGYAWTGRGRDDGKTAGEHSAIFYRTDMFELLDSGDFWLSEHPDQPGLGWDAVCPRICSWGKFRHKPSGKEFMFANLHMDHVGITARREGARLVKQRLHEIAADLPAIVTGDFNVDQHSDSYATMTANGEMLDSYEIAPIRFVPNGTYNGFLTDGYTPSRIDHIFVSPGIKVEKYGVLTDTYRSFEKDPTASRQGDSPEEVKIKNVTPRTPSDHFPVMVAIDLP